MGALWLAICLLVVGSIILDVIKGRRKREQHEDVEDQERSEDPN
jgi:hypothetical protein